MKSEAKRIEFTNKKEDIHGEKKKIKKRGQQKVNLHSAKKKQKKKNKTGQKKLNERNDF